jgi:hypothetical protein
MKKPINGFAWVFWALAAIFILGDVPFVIYFFQLSTDMATQFGRATMNELTLTNVWNSLRAALTGSGELLALGVVVELLDQIRWNALPEGKRHPRRWL